MNDKRATGTLLVRAEDLLASGAYAPLLTAAVTATEPGSHTHRLLLDSS
jgi:hypothetical protein